MLKHSECRDMLGCGYNPVDDWAKSEDCDLEEVSADYVIGSINKFFTDCIASVMGKITAEFISKLNKNAAKINKNQQVLLQTLTSFKKQLENSAIIASTNSATARKQLENKLNIAIDEASAKVLEKILKNTKLIEQLAGRLDQVLTDLKDELNTKLGLINANLGEIRKTIQVICLRLGIGCPTINKNGDTITKIETNVNVTQTFIKRVNVTVTEKASYTYVKHKLSTINHTIEVRVNNLKRTAKNETHFQSLVNQKVQEEIIKLWNMGNASASKSGNLTLELKFLKQKFDNLSRFEEVMKTENKSIKVVTKEINILNEMLRQTSKDIATVKKRIETNSRKRFLFLDKVTLTTCFKLLSHEAQKLERDFQNTQQWVSEYQKALNTWQKKAYKEKSYKKTKEKSGLASFWEGVKKIATKVYNDAKDTVQGFGNLAKGLIGGGFGIIMIIIVVGIIIVVMRR